MDEVNGMTVSPPLQPKAQTCTVTGQDARQTTISIQTSQILSLPVIPVGGPSAGAGATVFVGGTVPPTSASVWQVPVVQKSNGFQSHLQHQQQQEHHLQSQTQPAHVVKIRINPEDSVAGKVVSTVRVTLDENGGSVSGSNNINDNTNNNNNNIHKNNNNQSNNNNKNNNHSIHSNGVQVQSSAGSNVVNGIGSDQGCVRISVVGNNEVDASRAEEMIVQRDIPGALTSSASRSSSCFYYSTFQNSISTMVMSSGQCSPSDTLDSGTCSDLDGTPPPLPKKKNASPTSSTVILGTGQHNRTGSLTSSGADIDSDDNESNVSCDSLNSSELNAANDLQKNSTNVTRFKTTKSLDVVERKEEEPDEHLLNGCGENLDADNLRTRPLDTPSDIIGNADNDRPDYDSQSSPASPVISSSSHLDRVSMPSSSLTETTAYVSSKSSSTPRVQSPDSNRDVRRSPPMVKECAYEDIKMERMRLQDETAAADFYANFNRGNGTKYLYDDDRFYKFHLNETFDEAQARDAANAAAAIADAENDEFFAGYKMLDREAIRSAKGTVRGVKNRVRAGIATFLQQPATKNYKLKDAGKVVVYTTTMGIVRETYYACTKVKQILRTHMVKYEDRDMFMSTEYQKELRDRIQTTTIQVPQLFIDGQYIGDAEVVERLNESGELRRMLKPYKSPDACTTCQICGGYRLLPCSVCNGSKKSVHRNDFTTEFVALKCMNCDEVGLVRCPHC